MAGAARRIMIVEDDPDGMKILDSMLAAAGYEVLRAYGVDDALRKLKTQVIDVILTDLAMPKVSGVELIAEVKKDWATRNIPVIAVTAFMWDPIAQSAGQMGCDGFIAKPFTRERLVKEIERHFEPDSGSIRLRS
jgi:CheY-like chemotaxis protein